MSEGGLTFKGRVQYTRGLTLYWVEKKWAQNSQHSAPGGKGDLTGSSSERSQLVAEKGGSWKRTRMSKGG